MVIACKNCSRKFELNERLLKPNGSRVRCSRCSAVFKAYPPLSCRSSIPSTEAQRITQNDGQHGITTSDSEKRKHPRLPVSIPVLCDLLGHDGKAKDIQVGAIKEVSQTGLTVELFSNPISGEVALSFLNAENREVRVKAKVIHSKIQDSLKARAGLLLSGRPIEVDYFFTQVMKTHEFSAMENQQYQI